MVCYDWTIFERVQKNLILRKIIFKVVQIKFLAMHITNQNYILIYLRYKISSWNMILISNDFWHKRKIYNFDPYNVLLAIATNIPAAYDCFCAPGSHIHIYIYTAAQRFVISKIFIVFKRVSHQGCICSIKNTEILLQFKIKKLYLNIL